MARKSHRKSHKKSCKKYQHGGFTFFKLSDAEKQKLKETAAKVGDAAKGFGKKVSHGFSNMKSSLSNKLAQAKQRFADFKEDRAYKQAQEAQLKAERDALAARQATLRRSFEAPAAARRASLQSQSSQSGGKRHRKSSKKSKRRSSKKSKKRSSKKKSRRSKH